MELVEDDHGHTFQTGIHLDAPGEDSLGDHFNPGLLRNPAFEPDGIAHGSPDLLAEGFGHPPGRGDRRDPARFEHQDPSLFRGDHFEKRQGGARRLPGAGRGLQNR